MMIADRCGGSRLVISRRWLPQGCAPCCAIAVRFMTPSIPVSLTQSPPRSIFFETAQLERRFVDLSAAERRATLLKLIHRIEVDVTEVRIGVARSALFALADTNLPSNETVTLQLPAAHHHCAGQTHPTVARGAARHPARAGDRSGL